MPVLDPAEAKDLDQAIEQLVRASNAGDRERCLREIFVGKLDFTAEQGTVDLRGERTPIDQAVRIASSEGVRVVWATTANLRVLVGETRAISGGLAVRLGEDHLLVHSNANGSVWHFVYPTASGGKTVLRRMVVERDLPRRTVVMQLAKIYHDAKTADVRAALEHAYDVEPVTTEFFQTYREVFELVLGMIQGVPNAEQRRLFCQTFFNRLMFIYFLQRKGWLSLNGNTDYLPALWEDYQKSKSDSDFHTERLKVLFFLGLNNPDSRNLAVGVRVAVGEVPFLNGGLFESSEIDRACADAVIPDRAFDIILNRLFRRFNFTVSESTPYDIEVAVDPEMLGKVFEELVSGRHATGSYYTPRQVVAFMCREVLVKYLERKLPNASFEAIRRFVDTHEVTGLDLGAAAGISRALDELTVVDPACGSGAYLLGMLHELVELQQVLYSERLNRDPARLFEMKLHIIERSLYGADIDRFAVNIAMLRLWLSLIIEYDGDNPPPLPNLDFKLLDGDSLTAPNPNVATDLFRQAIHQAASELAALKRAFMRESGSAKVNLRRELADAESRLRTALSESPAPARAIDWRIQFAEVFDENGGFDIVLANPPYVSALEFARTHSHEERDAIRAGFVTATGAWDLFVPFFERGLQLLRTGGQLAYVSPNKYLSASYASSLRAFIRFNATLQQLVDLSKLAIFESASVYPVLTFLANERDASKIVCRLPKAASLDQDPANFDLIEVDQDSLDLLPDHVWGFLLSNNLELLARLLPNTVPMTEVADVMATTTAAESATYGKRLRDLNDVEDSFRVVNTGTIDEYVSLWGTRDLTHGGTRYRRPILRLADVSATRRALYGAPKILIAKMAKRCEAFLDSEGHYAGLNINCVTRPKRDAASLEFLCSYCNSKPFMFFYNQFFGALRMSGGYYQFQAPQIRSIPVPNVSKAEGDEIGRLFNVLTDALHKGDTATSTSISNQMDLLFASLVGLSPAELECLTFSGEMVGKAGD